MKLKLLIALMTTLLDEIIIFAILIWVLPMFGIIIPLSVLIVIGIGWTVLSILLFLYTRKPFLQKPYAGLTDMTGLTGTVIKDLTPEGLVKINNEIWKARALNDHVYKGEKVIVENREGLILMVRNANYRGNSMHIS